MTSWPKYPIVYEINTWVWLYDLSQKYEKPIRLGNVPAEEWEAIASLKVDAVWFMGVWERSPASVRIAMENEGLVADFRQALPDFSAADNIGSAYSVRRYVVDGHLGCFKGLKAARSELAERGIRLILDFVPNHVALDHPWVSGHPEYFVRGSADDLKRNPDLYIDVAGKVFARGRDPYFPPWKDVLQLNAFAPGLRSAAIETVSRIGQYCDGLRCDMAMLLMNRVFGRTWGYRGDGQEDPGTGRPPETEYWEDVIQSVRKKLPNFLFIAEAYWDLEWELQQQGFDYCYDKRLYDRLVYENAEAVRNHLMADLAYQDRLVRFIENHDEPRAASTFSPEKERLAALIIAMLPGARLFHEGQFEGKKIKLPVFLKRRPVEPAHPDLQCFYHKLLRVVHQAGLLNGDWRLCDLSGWPDNSTYRNLIAWCWGGAGKGYLIVVNLSASGAQGRVRLPWGELKDRRWRMTDLLDGVIYERDGDEMLHPGLYVDLKAWGFHFLKF